MMCVHAANKEVRRYNKVPLYQCPDCGLIFTGNHGKAFDAKTLYEGFYKNEIGTRFGFGIEYLVRLFRFFRALKIFTLFPRAKTILDIGSGRGWMLYYLKKYFHYTRAAGTQISRNAVQFSRNKLGLEIYDKDLLELDIENGSFDLITMWHVLEHVSKPEEYIAKIKQVLKKNGRLIIEVPNYNSWTRSFTQQYWLGLDLGYHVTFFTAESLERILIKYGFKIKGRHTFSLEYSTFISAQSIVSRITRSDQLFFRYLQAGFHGPQVLAHALLFVVISPICFIINVLLYFSKRGEILLISAEKTDQNE